jgi:hypothetical protein
LQVTGKLDVEDNPVAKQVYRLMKRRSLKEFSIGYSVPTGGEKRTKDGVNEISEIMLAECGPCLKGIDPKTELQEVKSALATQDLPSAEQQREEAKRVEREVEQQQIPEVPVTPTEPEPDLAKELQEVKARLEQAEKSLEDLKAKKADVTDKEPQGARSVDPLRKQAEAVALEVASGDLPKPPKTVEPKRPEPSLSLKELKQRTRDEMLGVLSGGTIE